MLQEEQLNATSPDEVKIEGFLTKVSAEENEITIKDQTDAQLYTVIVPHHQLMDIIKAYWLQQVLVKVRQTTYGVMVMEQIQLK